MKKFHNAAGAIAAICALLLFLYISVYYMGFNLSFYEHEYQENNTYAAIGVSGDELQKVTLHMMDYLKGKEKELNIEAVVNGQTRLFFSEKEIFHMDDVLGLFKAGETIKYASLAIFACMLIFLAISKAKPIVFPRAVIIVFAVFLLITILLTAIIALNFESAFTMFHEIFFSNDLWLLDPNVDLLINIVPLKFFTDISVRIAAIFLGMTTITGSACAVVWARMRKHA